MDAFVNVPNMLGIKMYDTVFDTIDVKSPANLFLTSTMLASYTRRKSSKGWESGALR